MREIRLSGLTRGRGYPPYSTGTAPMPPAPLYLLSAGGTAVALIAACVFLCERLRTATWLLRPLTHTGQLAVLCATGWRRLARRGPLEWVMRRLTG